MVAQTFLSFLLEGDSFVILLAQFCFSTIIHKSVEKNDFHIIQWKQNVTRKGYQIS